MESPKPGQKRPSLCNDPSQPDEHLSKRQRTATLEPEPEVEVSTTALAAPGRATATEKVNRPSEASFAREGLQRSIALALQHVGFDSASQEALESLTSTTETYIATFAEHLKRFAEAARRSNPTPTDFAHMLRKHNVAISSLKPHLQNPVKKKVEPTYYDPLPITPQTDYFRTTSTEWLGDELDGNMEKQAKPWIPEGLPAFPSRHTYKFTPRETAALDPAKKRAEALAAAQKGEKALRTINRATKMSQQKELRDLAQRNPMSKERYDAWESMMKAMMPDNGSSLRDRQDIADHSVIVDSSMRYRRREVPRVSSRGPLGAIPSNG
ncbi:bromodomain associated protein [Seiridium cupressi]